MNQSMPPPSGSSPIVPAKMPVAVVPAVDAAHAVTGAEPLAPHDVERAVMLRLQSHPSLRFTRLNVHQCGHNSICLEGFLESNDQDIDLCEVVRGTHGIQHVVNQVLSAQPPDAAFKKG